MSAFAQDDPFLVTEPTMPYSDGMVSNQPYCFNLINQAPYSVTGSISTNYFVRSDGIKTRHRSNFRLDRGDMHEVCTTGPFYDGNKLELVLRTLVPVFTCKTAVTGDIVIEGRYLREGGTETRANCLP